MIAANRQVLAALLIVVAIAGSPDRLARADQFNGSESRNRGLRGTISAVSTVDLAHLMTRWIARFKTRYPDLAIRFQVENSSLQSETEWNLAATSRRMTHLEVGEFEKMNGYKPTPVRVAIDALAVVVHPSNPVKELTLTELDALFSSGRRCGHPFEIDRWGQVGVHGRLANATLQLHGPTTGSGIYHYFADKALCRGRHRGAVQQYTDFAQIVETVASSANAIAYAPVGQTTPSVKVLPLVARGGLESVAPTPDNAISGRYPLAHFLYIYVNKAIQAKTTRPERELLKLVLSGDGQRIVADGGYIPLPVHVIEQELKLLR